MNDFLVLPTDYVDLIEQQDELVNYSFNGYSIYFDVFNSSIHSVTVIFNGIGWGMNCRCLDTVGARAYLLRLAKDEIESGRFHTQIKRVVFSWVNDSSRVFLGFREKRIRVSKKEIRVFLKSLSFQEFTTLSFDYQKGGLGLHNSLLLILPRKEMS